jgi:hypothetical protein
MIERQITLELLRSDFEHDFADPQDCPFATALKRNGYEGVNAGTLEARGKNADEEVHIKIEGVYLNGQRIDNPAFGFGPCEYNKIKRELEKNNSSKAYLYLTHSLIH